MFRIAAAVAAATALVACHMRPTPLSVQAGSTFALMLDASSLVGFGSGGTTCTFYSDRQRGQLVWTLDAPAGQGGIPLTTRLTTSLIAPTAAPQGISVAPRAIVALVDVPASTPEGTHTLHVAQQSCNAGGGVLPGLVVPLPPLSIRVLPANVTVGTATITGAPFPFSAQLFPADLVPLPPEGVLATYPMPALIQPSVPDPTVELRLSAPAWAAEVAVSYDDDKIELVDAVAWDPDTLLAERRPQEAWLRRTAKGQAEISAVGREAAFTVISLVFTLEPLTPPGNGPLPFDPSALVVTSTDFRGSTGAPLSLSYTKSVR